MQETFLCCTHLWLQSERLRGNEALKQHFAVLQLRLQPSRTSQAEMLKSKKHTADVACQLSLVWKFKFCGSCDARQQAVSPPSTCFRSASASLRVSSAIVELLSFCRCRCFARYFRCTGPLVLELVSCCRPSQCRI